MLFSCFWDSCSVLEHKQILPLLAGGVIKEPLCCCHPRHCVALSFPFANFACRSRSRASCGMLLGNRHHHWSLPSCCHHRRRCRRYRYCSIFIMKSCRCYHCCRRDHYCCCHRIATGAESSRRVVVSNCCRIVVLLPSSSPSLLFSSSRARDHCRRICLFGRPTSHYATAFIELWWRMSMGALH